MLERGFVEDEDVRKGREEEVVDQRKEPESHAFRIEASPDKEMSAKTHQPSVNSVKVCRQILSLAQMLP